MRYVLAFIAAAVFGACTSNGCTHPKKTSSAKRSKTPAKKDRETVWVDSQGRKIKDRDLRRTTRTSTPTRRGGSPLGTNLAEVDYSSRDWVFVDVFRMGSPWVSRTWNQWDDGRDLVLDANGWVKKLESDQLAATLVPTLGGGKYVLTYEGQGTVHLDGDDGVLSSAPQKISFKAKPNGQVVINVEKTNPADPVRNIRVVPEKFASKKTTPLFHPLFIERLKTFSVIRFMDWARTNGSKVTSWADRASPTFATQSTASGIAYEHMIALANAAGADPWFCIPHKADDTFVRSLAQLILQNLDKKLNVYVEYSNEVWNEAPDFTQSMWVRDRAMEDDLDSDPYIARLKYQSRRSVEIFKIFEEVFGGPDRLVRVIGSQVGAMDSHETLLAFEEAGRHTDALAIAPYFGHSIGDAEREKDLVDNTPSWILDRLENNGLPDTLRWIGDSAKSAKQFGVRLIAYEGGQHLVAHPAIHNNPEVNARLDGANRDPRMKALYLRLLKGWKAAGGELFVHFTFVQEAHKWGRWGGLEFMDQSREEAPKHDALMTFAKENPRWW